MDGVSAEKRFRREFGSLEEIFGFIDALFAGSPVDPRTEYVVKLAVEELFTNMVKYNPGVHDDILIELHRLEDRVAVSLTDFDSDRFDIRSREDVDVDRPIEERTPGGLGIHLIRKLMDRIDYEYEGRRSRTTFVKMLE